ncbi:MAG: gluconate transporter [Oscillospiraceae bacterium]|nr:gluconate transporter [Oscillospiraceae bacterium]
MGSTWILISFLITLAALVIMLAVFKFHPVIGLFASAILAGILTGMPLTKVATALANGFGGTLTALGLVVAFGCILSFYLEKSGAIDELAKWMVRTVGPKNDVFALGIASYIISIPVFFGSAYVMLAPLSIHLAKLTNKSVLRYACSVSIGLLLTHCCVAPTPGPLAVAGMINANLGWFIIYGLIVTLPAMIFFCKVYPKLFKKDDAKIEQKEISKEELALVLQANEAKPSAGMAIFLILLPVVLIIIGTIGGIFLSQESFAYQLVSFLGNNNVAMFIAMCMTMICMNKYLDKPAMKYFGESLRACDIVVILGMGGSLAKVITESGIGDVLTAVLTSSNMPILVVAFLLSAILRVALSSGTTAMLTTVGIFAPIAQASGASVVLVGLTICAATVGMLIHTDTAFWMAQGLFDIEQKDVLRSVSIPCTLASVVVFVCILILSAFAGVLPGLH